MKGKVLIINKPKGLTSRKVADIVRQKLKVKKVGHAGTLDPLAEGVLIILTGKKTKEQARFMALEKEYVAEVEFGVKTNTFDGEGKIMEKLKKEEVKDLNVAAIKKALPQFIGKIKQKVPSFSAIKVSGKRLYKLARKGSLPQELPKREVKIKEIKILSFKKGTDKTYPLVKIRVTCGKGVYIRQLAVDLGEALGFPSYLKSLVRTRVGKFTLKKALSLSEF